MPGYNRPAREAGANDLRIVQCQPTREFASGRLR
jgi:hypothetical protein